MPAAATAWMGSAKAISQISNERRDERMSGETLAETKSKRAGRA
jgi:hypothetical protein